MRREELDSRYQKSQIYLVKSLDTLACFETEAECEMVGEPSLQSDGCRYMMRFDEKGISIQILKVDARSNHVRVS